MFDENAHENLSSDEVGILMALQNGAAWSMVDLVPIINVKKIRAIDRLLEGELIKLQSDPEGKIPIRPDRVVITNKGRETLESRKPA